MAMWLNVKSVQPAVDAVEDTETDQKNLKTQGNEFVFGLQNAVFQLNKAVLSVESYPQTIDEISQKLTLDAHDITQAIHNYIASELKFRIKKSLQDVEAHVHSLSKINLTQKGGRYTNDAIDTLLKTTEKLEINAKFLNKSKEHINEGIQEILKRIEDSLNKITIDEEKVSKEVTDQLRKLIYVSNTILDELDEYIHNYNDSDTENLKVLKEVSENIEKICNDIRANIKDRENLADVKLKLSSVVTKLAEELEKLVVVEEQIPKIQTLDEILKSVLIEGLAGVKSVANRLEVIVEQQKQ